MGTECLKHRGGTEGGGTHFSLCGFIEAAYTSAELMNSPGIFDMSAHRLPHPDLNWKSSQKPTSAELSMKIKKE